MAENAKSRLVPLLAGGMAVVGLAIGGAVWWTGKQHYERTDNAFIQADKVTIAPLVDGYVAQVLVNDNQPVRPGEVLVRIRPLQHQGAAGGGRGQRPGPGGGRRPGRR